MRLSPVKLGALQALSYSHFFFIPLQTVYWTKLGLTETEMGHVQSVFSVTILLTGSLVGRIVDRFPRRLVLTLVYLCGTLAAGVFYNADGAGMLMMANVGFSFAIVLSQVLFNTMVADNADHWGEHRLRHMGTAQGTAMGGAAVMQLVSGGLFALYFMLPIITTGVAFALGLCIAMTISTPIVQRRRLVTTSVPLRKVYPIVIAAGILWGATFTSNWLFQLKLRSFNIPLALFGAIFATAYALNGAGSKLRWNASLPQRFCLVGALSIAVAYGPIAVSIPLYLALHLTSGATIVMIADTVRATVREDQRGRVNGYIATASRIFSTPLAFMTGPLVMHMGIGSPFAVWGLLLLVAALLARKYDH